MEELSLSSHKQARGIEQIGKAIAQMETATQTTSATSEQSAATAEELTAPSESLKEVVAIPMALVSQGEVLSETSRSSLVCPPVATDGRTGNSGSGPLPSTAIVAQGGTSVTRTSEFAPPPQGVDFARLISGIRAGDASVTEEFCQTLRPGLLWMVRRALGPQGADDIVCDVLRTATRSIQIGPMQDADSVLALVRAITRDQIRTSISSRLAPREYESEPHQANGNADRGPSLDDVVRTGESDALIQRELSRLPSRHREILVRFYLIGETAEEICRGMGLTLAEFRLTKGRAQAKFRQLVRQAAAGKEPTC